MATTTTTTTTTATARSASSSPDCWESFSQSFQVWALRHVHWWNPLTWIFIPLLRWLSFKEGVDANSGSYLYHKRCVFGDNFCCAGGVWMGEWPTLVEALADKPQARGYRLASSLLDKKHVPCHSDGGGRKVFLLSLSQKGAGGNDMWEAVRSALEDYAFATPQAMARGQDETAQKLLQKLASDYREMGGHDNNSDDFFDNPNGGLLWFLLRYLHYVILGLDPYNDNTMDTLSKLHYDSTSAAYYLKVAGNFFQCLKFRDWPEQMQAVAEIYTKSPALEHFPESSAEYNNLTKQELGMAMVSMMSLAGMVGPQTLALIMLGRRKLNDYQGHQTHLIDVREIWDGLDLDNRDQVQRYLYECARLRCPVSNSHRIATEPFTVTIRGKDRTFPKGTTIFIPMIFGMLDETIWGDTTFEFNHNRENLCPYSMVFHSVGDRTNGRICPGRDIAVNMLINVLVELGKGRPASA